MFKISENILGRNMFVTSYSTKVICSVLRVVIFHFACWTPFWIFVLVPMLSYFRLVDLDFLQSNYSQKLRMFSR